MIQTWIEIKNTVTNRLKKWKQYKDTKKLHFFFNSVLRFQ